MNIILFEERRVRRAWKQAEQIIFTMLGEASTTEIARKKDAQGFSPNQAAAKAGGTIAGNARRQLEAESGRKVSNSANFKSLPEAKTR